MKTQHEEIASTSMSKVTAFKSTFAGKEVNTGSVIDYSNPFALPNVLETLDDGKYGSVTKEFEALRAQRIQNETHMEKSEKQVGEALNYEKTAPSSDANSNDISSLGMEEHSPTTNVSQVDVKEALKNDGLEDLWKDMSVAMECSKIAASDEPCFVEQQEECKHSYVLEDDLGLVCRICGVIEKSIETIFDYQWTKVVFLMWHLYCICFNIKTEE